MLPGVSRDFRLGERFGPSALFGRWAAPWWRALRLGFLWRLSFVSGHTISDGERLPIGVGAQPVGQVLDHELSTVGIHAQNDGGIGVKMREVDGAVPNCPYRDSNTGQSVAWAKDRGSNPSGDTAETRVDEVED